MRALLACLLVSACASSPPPRAAKTPAHFYDSEGHPLERYEAAWPALTEFFGASVPERVTIHHQAEGTSHFDPDRDAIFISQATLGGSSSERSIVAHETAHLALSRLSAKASTREPFRFMDEGLAMIVQKRSDGALGAYRRSALVVAAKRLGDGGVALAKLQAWSTYFGDPAVKADWDAYAVGAAFDFFLEETYGAGTLRRLFVDLAKTGALERSAPNVVGRTVDETQRAWEAYLRAVPIEVPGAWTSRTQ